MSATLGVEKNDTVKALEKEYIKMIRELSPKFKKSGYTFYPLSSLLVPYKAMYMGTNVNEFLEKIYTTCLENRIIWQKLCTVDKFSQLSIKEIKNV